jgi:hypothetical protein
LQRFSIFSDFFHFHLCHLHLPFGIENSSKYQQPSREARRAFSSGG